MRRISSAAIIANYGGSTSVIRSAIVHALGQRSVVLKFVPPALAPGPELAGCDIAVLDWQTGLENARRIIAGIKAAAPHCAVVVCSRRPLRRDQALQAGADICATSSDFGALCAALEKAVRTRR